MTLVLSIAAILISLASLSLSLYQYRSSQKIGSLTKVNEILAKAYTLRKVSQDLRNKIDATDDIDGYEEALSTMDSFLVDTLNQSLSHKSIPISNLLELERRLMDVELEFSLVAKQVDVAIDFNDQLRSAGYEITSDGATSRRED